MRGGQTGKPPARPRPQAQQTDRRSPEPPARTRTPPRDAPCHSSRLSLITVCDHHLVDGVGVAEPDVHDLELLVGTFLPT